LPSSLPPLHALRAFEAAGRRLSFKLAARELHVTPGAVSQQIRILETTLGITLFRRLTRSVELTREGQLLLPVVSAAFERIADTTRQLARRSESGVLTVSVIPSLAARWLVPRLGRFRERHPEIDVRISPSTHLVDFAREDVDLGIRRGLGRYPGLSSSRLMTEEFFPVCAPAIVRGRLALRSPSGLKDQVLLHDESFQDWQTWLEYHHVRGVDAKRGPIFDDASMALEAAIEGQGVALTRTALALDALARRRLVKPFDLPMPARFAYYIVCPTGTETRPKVKAFRDWLMEQTDAGASALTPGSTRRDGR
jgi:LysR family glycine cleavage system transcriptional activator